ncbi:MAG: hypothetical protein KGM43_02440 [Planctomycetota bacterium]|nr:hypothetical protein [Planctomycetota bacterium]
MLKPLTMSLSLAVALGFCGVSHAGGGLFNKGCDTCGLASPQGVVASPQASAQCDTCNTCAPKCKLFSGFKMPKLNLHCKPKTYTYTWVLKKKRVWGHGGCDTCGSPVVPSSQAAPSPQGVMPAAQHAYRAPLAPAMASVPGDLIAAPAPSDEPPPAPEVGPQSSVLFSSPAGN